MENYRHPKTNPPVLFLIMDLLDQFDPSLLLSCLGFRDKDQEAAILAAATTGTDLSWESDSNDLNFLEQEEESLMHQSAFFSSQSQGFESLRKVSHTPLPLYTPSPRSLEDVILELGEEDLDD